MHFQANRTSTGTRFCTLLVDFFCDSNIIDRLFQNESTIQEEKILRKEKPFKPDWCSGKKEDTSKFAKLISYELKGQIFLEIEKRKYRTSF